MVFIFILLTLSFTADIIISHNLKQSEIRMFKGWSDIYSSNIQCNLVVMGGSRAWVQYDPHIIDSILGVKSYNLGIDGSTINRQVIKFNEYCRFNVKPEYVIQDLAFPSMRITKDFEREQFFPYFSNKVLVKSISEFENFNFFEKYLPAYRYIGYPLLAQTGIKLRKTNDYDKQNPLYKGYCGQNLNWDGSIFSKIDSIHYDQNNDALKLFNAYLKKAKEENIEVVFVYSPMYIGAIQKIVNLKGMFAMYDSIAKNFSIPILDYTYDSISYDTSYFYNAEHLNKKGAELFSTKLANDLKAVINAESN